MTTECLGVIFSGWNAPSVGLIVQVDALLGIWHNVCLKYNVRGIDNDPLWVEHNKLGNYKCFCRLSNKILIGFYEDENSLTLVDIQSTIETCNHNNNCMVFWVYVNPPLVNLLHGILYFSNQRYLDYATSRPQGIILPLVREVPKATISWMKKPANARLYIFFTTDTLSGHNMHYKSYIRSAIICDFMVVNRKCIEEHEECVTGVTAKRNST